MSTILNYYILNYNKIYSNAQDQFHKLYIIINSIRIKLPFAFYYVNSEEVILIEQNQCQVHSND